MKPAKLLFIEANRVDQQAFLRMAHYKALPWEVNTAETLAGARAHLAETRFDLIITADHLPDGEPIELLDENPDIPFVVVTGIQEQLALRTLERGAEDYIVKDVEHRHLEALPFVVERTLHRRAIHERERQLARELRESEQRFRAIFENAAGGIVQTDNQDCFVAVNGRFCEMVGYSRDELLGKSVHELTYPEDRPHSDDLYTQIHAGRLAQFHYDKRYLKRDGLPVWVHVGVSAVRDDEGRHLCSVGTVVDISARKAAEAQLRLLAAALDAAPNAVSLSKTDRAGTIVWVNPAFTTLTGYSAEEAIGHSHHLLSSGQQEEEFYRDLWETIQRGEVWRGELVNRRKDGTLYHEEMGITPLRDEQGNLTHFLAVKQDITARKQAEERLRESEERFAAFMGHLPGAAWMKDVDGRYLYANREAQHIFSRSLAELAGKTDEEIFPPDTAHRFRENDLQALQKGSIQTTEVLRQADGVAHHSIVHKFAVPRGDGVDTCVGGVAFDITERVGAEEDLKQSEGRVRRKLDAILSPLGDIGELDLKDIVDIPAIQSLMDEFFKVAGIPMAIIDLKGKVLVGVGWQDVCTKFHRMHPETLTNCIESDTILTVNIPPGEFRLYKCKNNMWDMSTPLMVGSRHLGNIFTGQFFFEEEATDCDLFRSQARQYGFDEEEYLSALKAAPRLSREKVNAGMSFLEQLGRMISQLSYSNVQLARSISERDSLMQALRESEGHLRIAKEAAENASAAKDQFLAVLSHELRTPMTPVLASVSMLQQDSRLTQDIKEKLEVVRRNIEMEARLIDDLLDVTRITRGKVELNKRPVELCDVIRRAAEVCMPDIEARKIHFGTEMGPDAPYVIEADPGRLQQVFWNLIKNAVKFTPPGGCIGIRCRTGANGDAVVEVNDSGIGIPPEALPHLFKPFEQGIESRKQQFGGLGLGLTISKAMVEMHDGTIEAFSQGAGKGATFIVTLPVLKKGSSLEQAPAIGKSLRSSKLRVLLVEDHGDTADMMKLLLESLGHDVTTAADVATAMAVATRDDFDLIISDLGLPDGTGLDLLRSLRAAGRMLPGIALSGYGQEQDIKASADAGFAAHLTKPVDVDRLAEMVQTVMAGGQF